MQLRSDHLSHVSIECNYFISVKWLTNINTLVHEIFTHITTCTLIACNVLLEVNTHTHTATYLSFFLLRCCSRVAEITGMARPPLPYSTLFQSFRILRF